MRTQEPPARPRGSYGLAQKAASLQGCRGGQVPQPPCPAPVSEGEALVLTPQVMMRHVAEASPSAGSPVGWP